MTIATLVQIIAACMGIIGSLFFAIGIMRQSTNTMANISSSYYGWNKHMVSSVAAQKADYLFGGGIIVLAFSLQLLSFMMPKKIVIVPLEYAGVVPWLASIATLFLFLLLRRCAGGLASKFEKQITDYLEKEREQRESQRQKNKG